MQVKWGEKSLSRDHRHYWNTVDILHRGHTGHTGGTVHTQHTLDKGYTSQRLGRGESGHYMCTVQNVGQVGHGPLAGRPTVPHPGHVTHVAQVAHVAHVAHVTHIVHGPPTHAGHGAQGAHGALGAHGAHGAPHRNSCS